MAIIARIVPSRISKSLSVLVLDPEAESGLAVVHSFRTHGMYAELATTFVNSINIAGRIRFDALVVRARGQLSLRQLSTLVELHSTQVCVLLHDSALPSFAAGERGAMGLHFVPASLPLGELVSIVRGVLASRYAAAAKPRRRRVCATAANGPTAGEFEMRLLPPLGTTSRPYLRRKRQ